MRNKHLSFAALLAAALTFCAAPAALAQAAAPAEASDKSDKHSDNNAAGDFYTCPMHPEVKSKKKGQCPKCKMDLRPARAEGASTETAAAASDMSAAPDGSHAASKMSIPDVELLDQDGRAVHFYTDLVKGKVVVVNFIFTTCTTICPPPGAASARRAA